MVSEDAIRHEIKTQVAVLHRKAPEDVTVTAVRNAVEDALSLDKGFLKSERWKDLSKSMIQNSFDEMSTVDSNNDASQSNSPGTSKKRKSPSAAEENSTKSKKPKPAPAKAETSRDDAQPRASAQQPLGDDLLPDDELSELEDDEADKSRRRRSKSKGTSSSSSKTKAKISSRKTTSTTKKNAVELTPSELEIKKLKMQLEKCGIRKVWGKEFKKFDSDKARIGYMRDMLHDAGMDGRFSEEKAKRIKEEREFSKDLAEIKEGNRAWGRESTDEEEKPEGRPKRGLAKGLAELDMFQDDEESE